MSTEAFDLKSDIFNSKTEQKMKDEVESQLKLSEYLLRGAKNKVGEGSEIYNRFKEEQNELKSSINESLKEDNKITAKELLNLRLELGNLLDLSDKHEVYEKEGFFSNNLWDKINGINRGKAEFNSNSLRNKDISEYSIDEAQVILEHLNKEYGDFEEGNFAGTDEENISDLADKKDVNVYQDRLIAKILGTEEKGFNNEYLKGFNKKEGNYLILTKDFENTIRDESLSINDINANELANYFAFLDEKGELNIDMLGKKIGINKINELKQLIFSPKSDKRGFREIISEYGMDQILTNAKETKLTNLELNNISDFNNIKYNDLDINTIKNNLDSTVINITSKKKILELLDNNINIPFSYLHKDIILDADIVNKYNLTILDFNRYSINNLSSNQKLLTSIIQKGNDSSSIMLNLINKLKFEILNNKDINKIFQENITVNSKSNLPPHAIDIIYNKNIPESKDELESIFSSIKSDPDNPENTDRLSSFILKSDINKYEYQIVDYIKNGGAIVGELFFNVLNKNIAKEILMREDGYRFAHFFPSEIYEKYPFLFKITIDNTPLKQINNFINFIDFPNFETVLYTIENIQSRESNENSSLINDIFSDVKLRQKIINILENTESFHYLPSQKTLVDNILQNIAEQNEKISELMKVQSKISHHIDQMTEENKLDQLEASFIQKLSVEGIEISNTQITELINLLTQTDINSKKLFIEKINNMNKLDTSEKNKLIETLSDIKLYTISQNIQKNINGTEINPELTRKTLINNFDKFGGDIDIYINSLGLTKEEKNEARKVLSEHQEYKIQSAQAIVINNCTATDKQGNLILDEEEFQKQVEEELQDFDIEEFTQEYDVDEKLTEIFTQKYIEHKNLEFLEEINSIDSQSQLGVNTQEDKKTYSYAGLTYEIPDVAVNNNFSIINYQTGEKIEISKDEKETIQDHPKALKNLIDTKQKLEMLGLDFIWDNRVEFIQIMKNTPGFNDTGKIDTSDKDYLNISEFNHLLQFVLYKTTGDENTNDYYTNMSKIRQINGENELNEKRNFVSGLSNIGQKFVELGFLTQSGTLNFHWANTKNYSDIT